MSHHQYCNLSLRPWKVSNRIIAPRSTSTLPIPEPASAIRKLSRILHEGRTCTSSSGLFCPFVLGAATLNSISDRIEHWIRSMREKLKCLLLGVLWKSTVRYTKLHEFPLTVARIFSPGAPPDFLRFLQSFLVSFSTWWTRWISNNSPYVLHFVFEYSI